MQQKNPPKEEGQREEDRKQMDGHQLSIYETVSRLQGCSRVLRASQRKMKSCLSRMTKGHRKLVVSLEASLFHYIYPPHGSLMHRLLKSYQEMPLILNFRNQDKKCDGGSCSEGWLLMLQLLLRHRASCVAQAGLELEILVPYNPGIAGMHHHAQFETQ